jgi:hypothetical protein
MDRTDIPTNGFVLLRTVLADADISTPSRTSHSARKRDLFEQILDSYLSDNNLMYFPIVKSYHIR